MATPVYRPDTYRTAPRAGRPRGARVDAAPAPATGPYRIAGTVDELGVAGAYLVRLYRRSDGALMGETWSDAAGTYAFSSLPFIAEGYYVAAFDHGDNPVNAAIADYVTPELMT